MLATDPYADTEGSSCCKGYTEEVVAATAEGTVRKETAHKVRAVATEAATDTDCTV